jgi:3-phosphoshikimate 1-carboxyvinyltransferase
MSSAVVQSYHVRPIERTAGTLTVPGDKSISHRALMLAGIADGTTYIDGFLESEDCLATLRAMRAVGVRIERPATGTVIVHGVGIDGLTPPDTVLDMGNSGTAMRLMTGLLAGQRFDSELVGDASLMRRPMERAAQPLRLMGATIETRAGRPPIRIKASGRLAAIEYPLPVASAQVKSAVLLAGLSARGTTVVIEPSVTRDHTERMLVAFGAPVECDRGTVRLEGGTHLDACHLTVPGDFSSAAFFIVAACLGADEPILIRNVGVNPTRTGLLDMLALMGADIRLVNHRSAGAEPVADIEARRSDLNGIEVPAGLVPLAIDEFPAFFIAAACATGRTLVTGAAELRVKESDRIAAMAAGLAALGVACEPRPDGMVVEGIGTGARLTGGVIDSQGDHRIAMAFAVASARAAAPLIINDVANVATSFPGFVTVARAVGLDIEEQAGTQP